MTATLLFNIVSTIIEEFVILQNLAFQFPVTKSVCVLQLESPHYSCLHFEMCECQGDALEQDRDGSHMLPYRGCMPDVPRFPTGSTAGVTELYCHCLAEQCHAEVKHLF
jgi:hypothetical protein